MNSDQLASMYAEIVRGTSKAQSRFRTEPDFDELWTKVSGEVEAVKGTATMFEVPNEVPGGVG